MVGSSNLPCPTRIGFRVTATRYVLIVNDGRADAFTKIFGRNRVPIVGPEKEYARLPRLGRQPVYKIDLGALNESERQRLSDYLASLWDMPTERVQQEIGSRGVPIRAENTVLIDLDPEPDFA